MGQRRCERAVQALSSRAARRCVPSERAPKRRQDRPRCRSSGPSARGSGDSKVEPLSQPTGWAGRVAPTAGGKMAKSGRGQFWAENGKRRIPPPSYSQCAAPGPPATFASTRPLVLPDRRHCRALWHPRPHAAMTPCVSGVAMAHLVSVRESQQKTLPAATPPSCARANSHHRLSTASPKRLRCCHGPPTRLRAMSRALRPAGDEQ